MFDVAIIGGGVVGCAIARAVAACGGRLVLLERGSDILSGASKGNSAILHTGFDAPPGSVELAAMRAGYREYRDIRGKLGLPLLETGAHLVAWTEEEAAKLQPIVDKAWENGVSDVQLVDLPILYRQEPHLAQGATGAVLIPGEHVIDPWSAPLAYVMQAVLRGAVVVRDCALMGANFDGQVWHLTTSQGPVKASLVINAAGLYGDSVEALARNPTFSIRPRKGQFVVFDKSSRPLISSIILPVPTDRTKGVLIAPTIFGNLLVGPTAEEVPEREQATVDQSALTRLVEAGIARIPALQRHEVTAVYAGLRPATEQSGYILEALTDRNWITVAGIRSTGLTAALGIAAYVRGMIAEHFGGPSEMAPDLPLVVPNLADHLPRAIDNDAPGEIVCHCEGVTRSEIETAVASPLPPLDLAGLKRRTRATMGRCQGFYCLARLAQLAPGLVPTAAIGKAGS